MTHASAQSVRLCVFVRAPVFGTVKTRLARTLGHRAALGAYQQLVHHALSRLRLVPGVQFELWVAGDPQHPQVLRWAERLSSSVHTQCPGNLGQRMYHALFAGPAGIGIVVGTDCPTLDAGHIDAAISALRGEADVVTAPALDGGYGLIAMDTRQHRTFNQSPFQDIPWGGASVHADTLVRCRELALHIEVLPPVWDVDEPDDWRRFQQEFAGGYG